jgi:hypothetical protein
MTGMVEIMSSSGFWLSGGVVSTVFDIESKIILGIV